MKTLIEQQSGLPAWRQFFLAARWLEQDWED
jgi:hypothetical protein